VILQAIVLLLLLILPITALVRRQVPAATVVKMAAAWAVIFAIGLLVFSLLHQGI
jgi:hypothetical protein